MKKIIYVVVGLWALAGLAMMPRMFRNYAENERVSAESVRVAQANAMRLDANASKPAPTFDPTWTVIPDDFVGDNLEQVVLSLGGKEPPAKGEFESTPQYDERLEAERAKFVNPEHYVFLDTTSPDLSPYNADEQEFTLHTDFKTTIKRSMSYAIALEGESWGRVALVVPVRREEAEEFSKLLVGLLYVVRPTQKGPYEQIGSESSYEADYMKRTEDAEGWAKVLTLKVRSPIEVWVFNNNGAGGLVGAQGSRRLQLPVSGATRKVLFRYTFTGQERGQVLPTTLSER